MSCTPTPTSTRWGSQTTSTQHSFQTNVPTTIVLRASQISFVLTSCISTTSPGPSPSATGRENLVETSSSGNGSNFWQGFRNAPNDAEETASAKFPFNSATATPTLTLGKRQNGDCAAFTTITSWIDTPAETRTSQTDIMTWTWETFGTQVALETLFAPCPTPETVTQTRQPPTSSAQPPKQPPSAAAAQSSTSSTPTAAASSTTPAASQQQPSQPDLIVSYESASSASSSQSSSTVRLVASAAAMQSAVTSAPILSTTTASAAGSAGGVGVINNSALPPETKTQPGSNSDSSSSAEAEEKSVDAGAVAGGVFGALAGLALLLLGYRWYMQRKREAKRARNTWYEKSYESSEDYAQPSISRFSTSSQTQPTSIAGRISNARHMAQASLSGPFPPFFNTVRNSLVAPFGSAFKATPLHPAGSHPTHAIPNEGPSLPMPPVMAASTAPPHHPSPLRTAISPPRPFIGDTYSAAAMPSGYAGPPVPVINIHEPSSRGTSFAHDPSIVDSFPLPPEQQAQAVDERGASMYSTPSYYGENGQHLSGQFEYSEYQNSARESLATIQAGDRETKAWYDKELWDGGGAREGVQSTSGESLYGGLGTSEAGDRQMRPGFAL